MPNGTVKWCNPTKGFGFIQPDSGGADIFVHIKRANVIGARDQRTTSGPMGVMTRINRPKT